MSVAERTREAVRAEPFLYEGLRAGVINYTAAARYLAVGETETVAAALRRFAEELEDAEISGTARVRMHSGLGEVIPAETDADSTLFRLGETAFAAEVGDLTGVIARGGVSARQLHRILGRCQANSIDVSAAGMTGSSIILVVGRGDGPSAVRMVESVCE